MWVSVCIYMCESACTHRWVSIYTCTYMYTWVSTSIQTHRAPWRWPPSPSKQPCGAKLRRREAVCFTCRKLAEMWPWKKQHKCTYRELLSNYLLRKRKESGKRARKQGREAENWKRRQGWPFKRGALRSHSVLQAFSDSWKRRGRKWVTLWVLWLGKWAMLTQIE